jgi:hypothetical protein
MREIYLQNAEFQKHLKLVAKYLKPGIMQWKAQPRNAAQLEGREEQEAPVHSRADGAASGRVSVMDLTNDAHLQRKVAVADLSTVDLLLDFKALCNKL